MVSRGFSLFWKELPHQLQAALPRSFAVVAAQRQQKTTDAREECPQLEGTDFRAQPTERGHRHDQQHRPERRPRHDGPGRTARDARRVGRVSMSVGQLGW